MTTCESCKHPLDAETEALIKKLISANGADSWIGRFNPPSPIDMVHNEKYDTLELNKEADYGYDKIKNSIATFGMPSVVDILYNDLCNEDGGEDKFLDIVFSTEFDLEEIDDPELKALVIKAKTDKDLARRIVWSDLEMLVRVWMGE